MSISTHKQRDTQYYMHVFVLRSVPVVSRLGPHAQCERMDAARERRFEGWRGGRREVKESKNRRRDTMRSGEGDIIDDRMGKAVRRLGGEVTCHIVLALFLRKHDKGL